MHGGTQKGWFHALGQKILHELSDQVLGVVFETLGATFEVTEAAASSISFRGKREKSISGS